MTRLEEFSGRAYRLAYHRLAAGEKLTVGHLRAAQADLDGKAGVDRATTVLEGRPWSAARPTDCSCGRRHGSRLEARVCAHVRVPLAAADGYLLLQQIRLPAFTLAPRERGAAFYVTIDFGIVHRGRLVRLIDAKGRRSRDWARGRAAIEASYGIKVEEIDREGLASLEIP